VAAVLALLAVGLLAVLLTGTYGLTAEYGFVAGDLQPVDVGIVLLLGLLAVLLLLGAQGQVGTRRPSTPVLAVTVLALFAGGAAVSSALGGAAHARRAANVASACSAQDRALLAAVEFAGYRDGPHGNPDGGCVLRLHPATEAEAAGARLTAELERDGWRPSEPRGDAPTFERDGAVLMLSAVSDDKTTEILLTLQ